MTTMIMIVMASSAAVPVQVDESGCDNGYDKTKQRAVNGHSN